MGKPEVLNIFIDEIYENKASSLTPTISWQYYDVDGDVQYSYRVKIGSHKGLGDILDTGSVVSSDNSYIVETMDYSPILKYGLKYYITVSVENSSESSDETKSEFYTSGSYWENYVDNAMGWAVDFFFKTNGDYVANDSFSSSSSDHHDVEFSDGAYSFTLEIYLDRVIIRSSKAFQYKMDTTKFRNYRVSVIDNDIKLYVDGQLALNLLNKNTLTTSKKKLNFGSVTDGDDLSAIWGNISIDLDANTEIFDMPSEINIDTIFFQGEQIVNVVEDPFVTNQAFVATNPDDVNKSGKIYKISHTAKPISIPLRPVDSKSVNKVVFRNGEKWFSTFDKLFRMNGKKLLTWGEDIKINSLSSLGNFKEVETCSSTCAKFENVLRIDNVDDGGLWYYKSLSNSNSDWYENVDNERGWSVEFRVRVASGDEESAGISINDGRRQEKIFLYEDRIELQYASITKFVDLKSSAVDISVIGKGSDLHVFLKRNSLPWEKVVDASGLFTEEAQVLADSGSLRFERVNDSTAYAMWHASVDGAFQIFISKMSGGLWGSEKQLTFEVSQSMNPSFYVDSNGVVHFVYQDNQFGNNEIVYAQYNGYGVNKRVRITDAIGDSTNPKIVRLDDGENYIFWLDSRGGNVQVYSAFGSENSWSGSNTGGLDFNVTSINSIYEVKDFDVDSDGENIFLAFVDDSNGLNSVFYKKYNGSWGMSKLVSNVSFAANKPSVSFGDEIVHIFWEDSRLGSNRQVYYNYVYNEAVGSEVAITSDSSDYYNVSSRYTNGLVAVSSVMNGEDVFVAYGASDNGSGLIDIKTIKYDGLNGDISNVKIDFKSSDELLVSYISWESGVASIFYFEDLLDYGSTPNFVDFSGESIQVSNAKESANISFGVIGDGESVSDWHIIRYNSEMYSPPIILESWDFSYIKDFDLDSGGNLSIIDNSGLSIYRLISSDEDELGKNRLAKLAEDSSPFVVNRVFSLPNKYIFAVNSGRIYYHLPLSSDDVDQDIRWFEVDNRTGIYDIKEISLNGSSLWVGGQGGVVAVDFDSLVSDNVLSEDLVSGLSGDDVRDVKFNDDFVWIVTDRAVNKISNVNGAKSVVAVEDGLIDVDLKEMQLTEDGFWIFGPKGLVFYGSDKVAVVYRDLLSSNEINDISYESGVVWIGNEMGLEMIEEINDGNYLLTSEDGYSVTGSRDGRVFRIISNNELEEGIYTVLRINGSLYSTDNHYVDWANRLVFTKTVMPSNSKLEMVYFDGVYLAYDFSDISLILEVGSSSPKRISNMFYDSSLVVLLEVDSETIFYKISPEGVSEVIYPFGIIILDKTPPIGTVDIAEQLSANQVLLDLTSYDEVSGVNEMVLSNYSNFTTDGETESTPIPFTSSLTWNLINTLGQASESQSLDESNGELLHIHQSISEISIVKTLLYATSSPSEIYSFNNSTREWSLIAVLPEESIEVMENFNNSLYVGTGDSGKVYVSSDLENFIEAFQVSDSLVLSLKSASDGRLYVGTGSGGKIYAYDGDSLSLLFDTGEENIYDIEELDGFLYFGTSPNGRVYRYSIINDIFEIIYDDLNSDIRSLGLAKGFNSESNTVYAGTYPNGKILRFNKSRSLFAKSFESIFQNVKHIRHFFDDTNENIIASYAVVDSRVIKHEDDAWKTIYIDENGAEVKDAVLFNGTLFVIKADSVATVDTTTTRTVYVKFVDFAGNESTPFNDSGELKELTDTERYYDTLTSEDIAGLSLKSRILIVSNSGEILEAISGNIPYLSAERIDEETGEYLSQIFDGTNDLISWDIFSFNVSTPSGTSIIFQIRSSDSEDDIEDEDWSDDISNFQDISGVSGRYIQFRAILSSQVRGISPVLNNVTIKSKSSFAVHYFSTNFQLPSNLKSGILTANVVEPTGTEIIFGINSDASSNWKDYQVIETNKTFYISESNKGDSLKIGVKFISTTEEVPELHEYALIFATEDGELTKINI